MKTSQEISELAGALSKAQASIQGAVKDGTNPHFKSQYATLLSVWDAWKAVGPANDLALIQATDVLENGVTVLLTRLAHKSGQWVEGVYPVRPQKEDPQGYGSAISYARRYSLAAMVGIAPEDDDAEGATDRKKPPALAAVKTPPAPPLPVKADKRAKAEDWTKGALVHINNPVNWPDLAAWQGKEAEKLDWLANNYADLYGQIEVALETARKGKAA